jgi:transcriptional repressor NF-X1
MAADPYNGFIIVNPRFALTVEEVSAVVKSTLPKTNFPVELEINFLPSEEVAMKPPLMTRVNMQEHDLQTRLESIKPALAAAISAQGLGKLQLARLDSSLNVLRRESDLGGSGDAGWSQVAASKSVPLRKVERTGPLMSKGGFAVLSLSSTRKKREREMSEVVDDWEKAELEEEEKEEKERSEGSSSEGLSGAESSISSPVEAGPADGIADGVGKNEVEVATKPGGLRWEDMDDEA